MKHVYPRITGTIVVALLVLSISTTSAAERRSAVHKILSCNIRVPLEEDDRAGNGWDARKDLCAQVIARCDGDIVCLQECHGGPLDDLKQRLKNYDSYGIAKPEPEFFPTNAILYNRLRYELISAGGMWLSETPHIAGSMSWDSARPRLANWIHLRDRASGQEMRVWNTHLDHIGQEARREQARVLLEAVAALEPTKVTQIVVGDMNAKASHPAIQAIKNAEFVDTFGAVHGPDDPGFTAHGFLGTKRSLNGKNVPGKIDWIFARGDVTTHSAEIIRDSRDGRYPSDHFFVTAEIELPQRTSK